MIQGNVKKENENKQVREREITVKGSNRIDAVFLGTKKRRRHGQPCMNRFSPDAHQNVILHEPIFIGTKRKIVPRTTSLTLILSVIKRKTFVNNHLQWHKRKKMEFLAFIRIAHETENVFCVNKHPLYNLRKNKVVNRVFKLVMLHKVSQLWTYDALLNFYFMVFATIRTIFAMTIDIISFYGFRLYSQYTFIQSEIDYCAH